MSAGQDPLLFICQVFMFRFFGGGFGGFNFGFGGDDMRREREMPRGAEVVVDLEVTLEELYTGDFIEVIACLQILLCLLSVYPSVHPPVNLPSISLSVCLLSCLFVCVHVFSGALFWLFWLFWKELEEMRHVSCRSGRVPVHIVTVVEAEEYSDCFYYIYGISRHGHISVVSHSEKRRASGKACLRAPLLK